MNGQTFLERLIFRQAAATRRVEARDADIKLSHEILELSRADQNAIWTTLRASPDGLDPAEAKARLASVGPNLIATEGRPSVARELWACSKSPLNALLLTLAVVSYFLGDMRSALVIVVMVVLSVITAFMQEHRSNEAAAKLRAMVKTTASVKRRDGAARAKSPRVSSRFRWSSSFPATSCAFGGRHDPGRPAPAQAKDLFINQSALTGEAMPSEKSPARGMGEIADPFDLPNMCFMGGNVVSGYATGFIPYRGANLFRQLADQIAGRRVLTSFDQGINRFTWLMIRFILVMVRPSSSSTASPSMIGSRRYCSRWRLRSASRPKCCR